MTCGVSFQYPFFRIGRIRQKVPQQRKIKILHNACRPFCIALVLPFTIEFHETAQKPVMPGKLLFIYDTIRIDFTQVSFFIPPRLQCFQNIIQESRFSARKLLMQAKRQHRPAFPIAWPSLLIRLKNLRCAVHRVFQS